MGQQPKIRIEENEEPRPVPEPGPAHRWRSDKPGIPDGPTEWPERGRFSTTGPDPGWALRIISLAELPDEDAKLRKVLTGLMLARSAELGRAPVREDLQVALMLCGYGDELPRYLAERRERWLEAVPHETRPGETAVAAIDRDLLALTPAQIREALIAGDDQAGAFDSVAPL
jgi:hypothetical protein